MTEDKDSILELNSAFFLDEWLLFNEKTWGVKAERVVYKSVDKDLPRIEGVIYLNKKGKIVLPPNNAYLPFRFYHTNTRKDCQLYSQWMQVTDLMAADFCKRGWKGNIVFPPGFIDGRAFKWRGANLTTGYTFIGELPVDESALDTSVRKNIRKAEKLGYRTERTKDWATVLDCLNKTAEYKGFDDLLSQKDLELCQSLLGDDYLFAFLSYDFDGCPVSAQVKLAMPGGVCIDWLAGTDRKRINDGVNQLLYFESLKEISKTETVMFDNCGANIEPVARAKAAWGFELTPYIVLLESPFKEKIKYLSKKSRLIKKVYYLVKRILK